MLDVIVSSQHKKAVFKMLSCLYHLPNLFIVNKMLRSLFIALIFVLDKAPSTSQKAGERWCSQTERKEMEQMTAQIHCELREVCVRVCNKWVELGKQVWAT